ncbi:zinc finger CCHC domain-containing protein 17-like [Liolophura sinensis]|uniref:zinc finger CCHC domain-containing protein 17-like n=1 Tax=Liolophura sinensis TaxID=3198878 RepID=UPI00315868C0
MSRRCPDSNRGERRQSGDFGPPPELYSVFQGEVAAIQQYGVFVRIPGSRRQGLVHKSQMSRTRVDDPSEMLSKGEMVYCKVISHDGSKIGLSMKVVNQTTGADLDVNNVELVQDEQRRRTGHKREIQKIELGAFLNTMCKKCGAKGHFTQDCFHVAGGKAYELVPDIDEMIEINEGTEEGSSPPKKRKKEKKKHKKHKSKEKKEEKQKRRKESSDSDSSSHERSARKYKSHKSKKQHHHRSRSECR